VDALALIIAIIAIILSLLPLVYTQILGVVVGIGALVVAFVGRRQALALGRSPRRATIALGLGAVAVALSGSLYVAYTAGGGEAREEVMQRLGTEFKGGDAQGNLEFRRAMKRAIERARARQEQQPKTGEEKQPQPER
jgi:hypothetical protein